MMAWVAYRAGTTTSPTTTSRYLYVGTDQDPTAVTNGSGTITEFNVHGPLGTFKQYSGPPASGTVATYLFYDGRGNLAATATTGGTRTAAYSYDPFGAPNDAIPSNKLTDRWLGRWNKHLDTASNLILMGARPYDPFLGRFLAVDPVDGGALNAYDYAGQDPVNNDDLGGLSCGPGGWGDKIVPDSVFSSACSFHDHCYGGHGANYGRTRSECDSIFKGLMFLSCQSHYGKWNWRRYACYDYAETLYLAVRGPGHYYQGYYNGQYQACVRRGNSASACKKWATHNANS